MISEPSRLASVISVTSLYPRQILLKNLSMKYENSFQSPENGSADKTQKPEKKKKTKGIPKPGIVLQSVAAYLKKNGFSKALLAFQSESHIEIDAGKEQALDLDDVCHYYLKRSETPIEASIKDLKELDTKKDDIPKKDGGDLVIKERKGETNEDDETESNSNKTDLEKQVSDRDDTNNNIEELHKKKSKEKKKKKSKMGSDSLGDTVEKTVEQIDHESKSDELHTKSKVKKKKNKLVSDCSENIEPENGVSRTETLLPESSNEIQLNEINLISKDKKKKKHKSEPNLDKIDSKNGDALVHEEYGVDAEKKGSKKRKRSSHEEKESLVDSQDLGEETKVNKMEGSKDNKTEKLPKENGSLSCDNNLNFSKKRKVEKSKKGVEKFSNTSLDKGHESLTNGEDDGQRKEDGSLGTNGGGEPTPKTRKELKGSAEPKTVNSFQRVKVEKVQFADERLQDNSYWAKDGADIGYGAKAQEVLGQVRGRDFRHEKTKKKRGSYRGGLIDLQSHSIKFNYSEEDE